MILGPKLAAGAVKNLPSRPAFPRRSKNCGNSQSAPPLTKESRRKVFLLCCMQIVFFRLDEEYAAPFFFPIQRVPPVVRVPGTRPVFAL